VIVAMEIDPRNISVDKIASSPLGGDDKQGALYLTDYDTFATAEKKSPREAVLYTVKPACVLSCKPLNHVNHVLMHYDRVFLFYMDSKLKFG